MDVNIKIGFDERAQTFLEGFYASVGRLLERSHAAGCSKCEENHAKVKKNEEELSRTEKEIEKKEPEGTGEVVAAVPSAPSAPSVPTAEVAYSFEEIQLACAELVRAGKREDLAKLIREFDLSSLPELAKGQYNEFALKLRAIGGTI